MLLVKDLEKRIFNVNSLGKNMVRLQNKVKKDFYKSKHTKNKIKGKIYKFSKYLNLFAIFISSFSYISLAKEKLHEDKNKYFYTYILSCRSKVCFPKNYLENLLDKIPSNFEVYILKTNKNCYKLCYSLFENINKTSEKKIYSKLKLLKSYIPKSCNFVKKKIDAEKLLYLFKNEDYEEFVYLLRNKNVKLLPNKVLKALAISYLKLGYLDKAEKLLKLSLKKGDKDALNYLIEIYYSKGFYDKVIDIYKAHGEKYLKPIAKNLVFLAAIKLKQNEIAKKVLKSLKNTKYYSNIKKILRYKYKRKLTLSFGLDTNPEKEKKYFDPSLYTRLLFNLNRQNVFTYQNILFIFKYYPEDRFQDLNYIYVKFENVNKYLKKDYIFPYIEYLYSQNKSYSFSLGGGIKNKVKEYTLTLGISRIFSENDWRSKVNFKMKVKKINTNTLLEDSFKDIKDIKFIQNLYLSKYIKLGKYFEYLKITPSLNYGYSEQIFLNQKTKFKFQAKKSFYFLSTYEIGYLFKDKNLYNSLIFEVGKDFKF